MGKGIKKAREHPENPSRRTRQTGQNQPGRWRYTPPVTPPPTPWLKPGDPEPPSVLREVNLSDIVSMWEDPDSEVVRQWVEWRLSVNLRQTGNPMHHLTHTDYVVDRDPTLEKAIARLEAESGIRAIPAVDNIYIEQPDLLERRFAPRFKDGSQWDWRIFYADEEVTGPATTPEDIESDREFAQLLKDITPEEAEQARSLAADIMRERMAQPYVFWLAVMKNSETDKLVLLDSPAVLGIAEAWYGEKGGPAKVFPSLPKRVKAEVTRIIQKRDLSAVRKSA